MGFCLFWSPHPTSSTLCAEASRQCSPPAGPDFVCGLCLFWSPHPTSSTLCAERRERQGARLFQKTVDRIVDKRHNRDEMRETRDERREAATSEHGAGSMGTKGEPTTGHKTQGAGNMLTYNTRKRSMGREQRAGAGCMGNQGTGSRGQRAGSREHEPATNHQDPTTQHQQQTTDSPRGTHMGRD